MLEEHHIHLFRGFVFEGLYVYVGQLEVEPLSEISGKSVEVSISLLDILSNDLQLIVLAELSHVRLVPLSHHDGLMKSSMIDGVLPVQGLVFLLSLLVQCQKWNRSQDPFVHEAEESLAKFLKQHHDFRGSVDFLVVSNHLAMLAVEVQVRTAKSAVDVVQVLASRILLDGAFLDLMSLACARGASQSEKFFRRHHADFIILDELDSFSPSGQNLL